MATRLNRRPELHMPSPARTARILRIPAPFRALVAFAGAAGLLFVVQFVAFAATSIPVDLALRNRTVSVRMDGGELAFEVPEAPTRVLFVPGSSLLREYQIDGTDNTNNFTEDASYVARLRDQPYFRFQDWMRDTQSYSSWQDVQVREARTGAVPAPKTSGKGSPLAVELAGGQNTDISARLMRLEAPAQVLFFCDTAPCGVVTINRNDRYVRAETLGEDGAVVAASQMFFPSQTTPFFAEIVYLLAHVALWSLALLAVLAILHVTAGAVMGWTMRQGATDATSATNGVSARASGRWRIGRFRPYTWDWLALMTILLSFGYICYVALVQYQAQPHILDASAYVMQAKIFASGWFSAPVPSNLDAFQGPFMVARNGHWFAQYPPGTSLLLAVGYLARLPWLIEPLLGALTLWGLYRLGRAWYGHMTAWLAVFLGALSPFYMYLAAAYLSHVPALFFEVYFLLFLVRYVRRLRARDLLLAALCWSGLLFTRELSAALVGVTAPALIGIFYRRRLWRERQRVTVGVLAALGVALASCVAYLLYNYIQTGVALLTPRALFSPADHLGFGTGIGFYGQHTVAAGLVNLDELLTSLSIDLYGWPFYLTLALIPLAFVGARARRRWDVFCLALAVILAAAQVAYFYHGIYLGPRYLFDTLPFLLLLTARGITNVPVLLARLGRGILPRAGSALLGSAARVAVVGAVAALLLCNVLYYLPRQLTLHANFSGLPATQRVDVGAIYRLHPANAVILTDDWYVYNYVLWPLNDPALDGPTLYAYAGSSDAISTLQREYPERRFYTLVVAPDGGVSLERLAP